MKLIIKSIFKLYIYKYKNSQKKNNFFNNYELNYNNCKIIIIIIAK